MLAKKIESLQHPEVLHWSKLLKSKSYRKKFNSTLVSGEKLIRELSSQVPSLRLITLAPSDIPAVETFLVTRPILKKITNLQEPDGYAAEIPLPSFQDLSSCQNLLILDQIADPGNLGALLRTAYALSWDGVVATPGTVDFFNDKALRAAKGATFHIPLAIESPETLLSWKLSFYVADIEGKNVSALSFKAPLALVLSNEGQGISFWANTLGTKVHIPMKKQAESLNVAS
ncbi:MAG TPA: RNA methyltransferase, partial [Chlamydiales bacterium]|nr:RNA methyltransferase [Chlamydiales bacterium]